MLENIIDMVNEGIIAIDCDGTIKSYNKEAKEIFGLTYNQGIGHPSGVIENGDIVIIGDNCFGEDDGGLEIEDLRLFGVGDSELKKGDAFVATGIVGSHIGSAVIEITKKHYGKLFLETEMKNYKIKSNIDFANKTIELSVDNQCFSFKYIKALGHMVILGGTTGMVKFYQAKGYTVRREALKEILMGKVFEAKGNSSTAMEVIGRNIFEVHPKETNINIIEFLEAARGKDISYINEVREINGRPTRCTLMQLKSSERIQGALLKVEDITELSNVMKQRDSAIASLNEAENRFKIDEGFEKIIGQSESIKAVKKLCRKAADTDSTILILGESGTGKGLIAESIHKKSRRRAKPFIYVNCTSIPHELLESEIFGYEGGAFTGARKEGKKGLFEAADGGSIFLDEIGEIPQFIQVKLLHVLQTKSFMRVGSTKEIYADVKIITATNKDLDKAVREGCFRKDLYYRINIFPIYIPPLRLRREDIYPLIHHLLPEICKKIKVSEKFISAEAIKTMIDYEWPGNVRELENILERAVNIADGDTIFPEHLNLNVDIDSSVNNFHVKSLKDALIDAEKIAIENALEATNRNKSEAMRILGIGKTSFYEKLKKYDI